MRHSAGRDRAANAQDLRKRRHGRSPLRSTPAPTIAPRVPRDQTVGDGGFRIVRRSRYSWRA